MANQQEQCPNCVTLRANCDTLTTEMASIITQEQASKSFNSFAPIQSKLKVKYIYYSYFPLSTINIKTFL